MVFHKPAMYCTREYATLTAVIAAGGVDVNVGVGVDVIVASALKAATGAVAVIVGVDAHTSMSPSSGALLLEFESSRGHVFGSARPSVEDHSVWTLVSLASAIHCSDSTANSSTRYRKQVPLV
jgi:hypothetical protein